MSAQQFNSFAFNQQDMNQFQCQPNIYDYEFFNFTYNLPPYEFNYPEQQQKQQQQPIPQYNAYQKLVPADRQSNTTTYVDSDSNTTPNNCYSQDSYSQDDETSSKAGSSKGKRVAPTIKSRENQKAILDQWQSVIDKNIKLYVNKHQNDWKKVSKAFETNFGFKATPNFLKNYFKTLPDVETQKNKFKFTHEFDVALVGMIEKFGFDWIVIATQMEVNDPMRLKNRYYSHIKKKNLYTTLLNEYEASNPEEAQVAAAPVQQQQQQQNYEDQEYFAYSPKDQKSEVEEFGQKLNQLETAMDRYGENYFFGIEFNGFEENMF
mmetsp:Transcript_18066/g.15788  ORF Transcript_18066/g.15788 Transcript_18066/m.15788 type:complete len:320 (-) Transcript_18066:366-1325(-)